MQNLEIKAKCKDFSKIKPVLKKIGAKYKGLLNQSDTYFRVKNGRLKMRVINNIRYELIYYHRANRKNERISNYEIVNIKNGKEMITMLSRSLNILCAVKKKRELYIYENIRIHLDTVRGLGKFLEFEIVCSTNKELKTAPKQMSYLKNEFAIKHENLISKSYSNLKNHDNISKINSKH